MSFKADIASMSNVADQILKITGEMGCLEGKEFSVEASLREALINAVVHGCRKDSSKTVRVMVCCDESRGMLIIVRDPGPGFDPASLPSPVIGQNLYSTHGRGIYLINQLMDQVDFEHGGTEIRMIKK